MLMSSVPSTQQGALHPSYSPSCPNQKNPGMVHFSSQPIPQPYPANWQALDPDPGPTQLCLPRQLTSAWVSSLLPSTLCVAVRLVLLKYQSRPATRLLHPLDSSLLPSEPTSNVLTKASQTVSPLLFPWSLFIAHPQPSSVAPGFSQSSDLASPPPCGRAESASFPPPLGGTPW